MICLKVCCFLFEDLRFGYQVREFANCERVTTVSCSVHRDCISNVTLDFSINVRQSEISTHTFVTNSTLLLAMSITIKCFCCPNVKTMYFEMCKPEQDRMFFFVYLTANYFPVSLQYLWVYIVVGVISYCKNGWFVEKKKIKRLPAYHTVNL